MKVSNIKTENRTTYLTVELDKSEIEVHLKETYEKMEKGDKFQGLPNEFNDPSEEVSEEEKKFEEAIKRLIPKTCNTVIKEQGIEAMSQPVISVDQDNPFKFEMAVPLWPVVKLGDYNSIRLESESDEVTNEDVDAFLEQMQHQNAAYSSVDRPIAATDVVVIDIEGNVMESPFIRNNGVKMRITPESTPELPGFSDNVIGLEKGEEKEFKLILPETFPNEIIAGKEASFKVRILDVSEEKLPDLDDDFAKKLDSGVDSIDSFRESVFSNIKEVKKNKSKSDYEEKVVDTLVGKSVLEFSPFMVDAEIHSLVNNYMQQMQMSCESPEEYEDKMQGTSEEKLWEHYRPIAQRKTLWFLVLNQVAELEKIEVSEADIDEEIDQRVLESGPMADEHRKMLDNFQSRVGIKEQLATRKTVERLAEIARG